jgi:hypothetical protein
MDVTTKTRQASYETGNLAQTRRPFVPLVKVGQGRKKDVIKPPFDFDPSA